MKFNCRAWRQARKARQIDREVRLTQWHRRFIWWPKEFPEDGYCHYLTWVEGKRRWVVSTYAWWDDHWTWDYRLPRK